VKTGILEKSPAFYRSELRADLKAVTEASDSVIGTLSKWLASVRSTEQFSDSDKWVPISRQTGIPLDDLQSIVGSVVWVTSRCAEQDVRLADLVDDLAEAGILGDEPKFRGRAKHNILALGTPIEPLLRNLAAEVSPELPLLHIQSFNTRCVFISEFDEEFDADKDPIQSYKPSLKCLHPRVTLRLTFHEDHDPLGILLSPGNLKQLKMFLDAAEIQLRVASQMVSEDRVVRPKDLPK
jgi:hypothetical protein